MTALWPFELVVFDMDGVLVDTSPCHASAWAELWAHLGIEGPDYESIAGRTTREVIKEWAVSLQPGREEIRDWTRFKQERARRNIESSPIVFPDSLPFLRHLGATDSLLALGTAASRSTADGILGRLGVADLFALVVTGDEVKRGKPSPEVYSRVLERLSIPAEATLVIEDSRSGLSAALRSGVNVVSVRSGERLESPRFLGSYPDLRKLLEAMGLAGS